MRTIARTFLVAALAWALGAPCARAASFDPLGFRLDSAVLFVHERDGAATITVHRTDTTRDAVVRYITIPLLARPGMDFTVVRGELNFPPGVSTETFRVPIVDHGMPMAPRTLSVALFGPWPIGFAAPAKALLTIIGDDPLPRPSSSSTNPLGLNPPPTNGNPLSGARFYIDRDSWGIPWMLSVKYQFTHPDWSHALRVIADQPGVQRFGLWDRPNAQAEVSNFLERAYFADPGSVPMIATYAIVGGQCANGTLADSPGRIALLHSFYDSLAEGISGYRAVMFLEMDSLITAPCLSPAGTGIRMGELRYAIHALKTHCPRLVIYLDAGAADAVPGREIAGLLKRAGVAGIQGFFLNSTHFDWTLKEIRFGQLVSRLTGGKHYVVNTGDSGQGPLAPPDIVTQGNEVLCNPPGRGLGPRPTAGTGYPNVDAFAWISNPGQSDGACVPGAPPVPYYWPDYAVMLVRNADYRVR